MSCCVLLGPLGQLTQMEGRFRIHNDISIFPIFFLFLKFFCGPFEKNTNPMDDVLFLTLSSGLNLCEKGMSAAQGRPALTYYGLSCVVIKFGHNNSGLMDFHLSDLH